MAPLRGRMWREACARVEASGSAPRWFTLARGAVERTGLREGGQAFSCENSSFMLLISQLVLVVPSAGLRK